MGGLELETCFFFSTLPSGYVKTAIEHGPFSLLISLLKMVIFHSYVSLPEGRQGCPNYR